MSALEELITGKTRRQRSRNLLDRHRDQFPLNRTAVDGVTDYVAEDVSDRVRLRRVYKNLIAAGISVDGFEPSQACPQPQVTLRASLGTDGYAKERHLHRAADVFGASVPVKDPVVCHLLQSALAGQGFMSLVTVNLTVRIIDRPLPSDAALRRCELGATEDHHHADLKDFREAARWIDIIPSFYDNSSALRSWLDAAEPVENAQAWLAIDSRFAYYEYAKKWKDAGYGHEDAAEWHDATGLTEFREANRWIEAGFGSSGAGVWLQGLQARTSYQMSLAALTLAAACRGAGLTIDDVRTVTALPDFRYGHLEVLGQLAGDGHSRQLLMDWVERGLLLTDIGRMRGWIDGYSAAQAEPWIHAARNVEGRSHVSRFDDPSVAGPWADAGIAVGEAVGWCKLTHALLSYEAAAKWIDAGETVDDARPWVLADDHVEFKGRLNVQHGSKLHDHDDVRLWRQVSPDMTPIKAAQLLSLGVSPEAAKLTLDLLG